MAAREQPSHHSRHDESAAARLRSAQNGGATPCRLTVLGATGSIGTSTLDLIARTPERFQVAALTAQQNVDELARLSIEHGAERAVIGDETKYDRLCELLSGSPVKAAAGSDALAEAACVDADCVVAAIVGAAGLRPTFAALKQGRRLALANKECLVSAGSAFMAEVERSGTELLPVDSEHSAAFQAIAAHDQDAIERITLTASGGPFRDWPAERLTEITPAMALKHPTWSMGAKISIDSATMMNKGLELIEAYHLFPVTPDKLDVVVHPQSIVHCLVAYTDGSVLAQMSEPDMRTPIALALSWPARMRAPTRRLDLARTGSLTFEAPDETRFPALRLAREALDEGGSAPAVLNAANEVAVAAFLAGRIGFPDIAQCVETTLEAASAKGLTLQSDDIDGVLAVDGEARLLAESKLSAYL